MISAEELEALLERAREALGEAGYQKLKAVIHTLSYVTELLETREATLANLRRLLCRAHSEKTDAVLEAGRHRAPFDSKQTGRGHSWEETGARPWAQRGQGVSRC